MPYEYLRFEVDDRVATITFARPDRLNAFVPAMMDELVAVLDRCDADDDVRVVIVTGEGRAFCAGADLGDDDPFSTGGQAPFSMEHHADTGGVGALRLLRCLKPCIAAINGPAIGIGATLTLPMDIRLAADDARIGFVFARLGIVPEACSSWFLPRLVGMATAMEWVASGRTIEAGEALRAGLVRSVHAPAELLPAARALARELADRTSAVAVALARQLMWGMLGVARPFDAHVAESRALHALAHGPEAAEGVAAFFERRTAAFPLRVSADLPEIPGLPYTTGG